MHTKQILFFILVSIIILYPNNLISKTKNSRYLKYIAGTEKEAIEWQNDLRDRLFDLMHMKDLILHGENIPFNTKLISSVEKKNYIYKELEINSTGNRRMKIIITLPSVIDGSCPAVVCVHGHSHNRYKVHDKKTIYKGFASSLAENGYITISADVGQHKVYEKGRTLMGERLWDLMRCIDYVSSMVVVDNTKIGCAGLSLGGEMTMWLGAMDKRVNAVVSSGFLTNMDQLEKNHCKCWKFDGLRELVDFPDIYSMIAPRPLMAQNGQKEPASQFPVPLAREVLEEIKPVYCTFDKSVNLSLNVHNGGHEVDLPSLLAFFDSHLKE
jgi:hypothetical protein